jgi:hypothetical protein
MDIEIEMPLVGRWNMETGQGENVEVLPLPFHLSYYVLGVVVDPNKGAGLCSYRIMEDDGLLTPEVITDLQRFISLPLADKRAEIVEVGSKEFVIYDEVSRQVQPKTLEFGTRLREAFIREGDGTEDSGVREPRTP